MENDSLRSKLIEEELSNKKLQEQFLAEKLKRVGTHNATDEEIKNDSQEIIKGIPLISSSPSLFFIFRSRTKTRYRTSIIKTFE
jgi:hypothetical protein